MSETNNPGAHFDFLPGGQKVGLFAFSLAEKGNQSFSHHIRAYYLRMLTICCDFIETFNQPEPGSWARTFIVSNSPHPPVCQGHCFDFSRCDRKHFHSLTHCLSLHISPWFFLFYLVWLHICHFSVKQCIHSQHAVVTRKTPRLMVSVSHTHICVVILPRSCELLTRSRIIPNAVRGFSFSSAWWMRHKKCFLRSLCASFC